MAEWPWKPGVMVPVGLQHCHPTPLPELFPLLLHCCVEEVLLILGTAKFGFSPLLGSPELALISVAGKVSQEAHGLFVEHPMGPFCRVRQTHSLFSTVCLVIV